MNYLLVPHRWKRFIYHMGCARDQYSIAEAGLIAGGKKAKKDDKQFSLHFLIHRSGADEAESFTDLSKPRKVHYQVHVLG